MLTFKADMAKGLAHLFLPSAHAYFSESRIATGLRRLWNTVEVAFEGTSYWKALALLDIWAWLAVWRSHEGAHAEAINAVVLEEAVPGAVSARGAVSPGLLRSAASAALHSKAAYGHLAVLGCMDSWQGYLQLLTVKQWGKEAVRRITPEQHLQALGLLTGMQPSDLVHAEWACSMYRPAYYVCLDRLSQKIVVSVRGTVQVGDYFTILDAAPEAITLCGVSGHAHAGMLSAASGMLDSVVAALQKAAEREPGWPVLVTGHSLGGGIAALLTMMLDDLQQRGDPRVQSLASVHSISIGTAAATCQQLGAACRHRVTSVVFGADALPMFSVRGARMLIDDVSSASRVAALVSGLVRRRMRAQAQLERSFSVGGGGLGPAEAPVPEPAVAARGALAPVHCGIVCGSRCSGLCGARVMDSAWELQQLGEEDPGCSTSSCDVDGGKAAAEAAMAAMAGITHERSPSVASDWSDYSTATSLGGAGEGGVLMVPPGRLLWVLAAPPAAGQPQQQGLGPHVVVDADYSLFQRFLLLPSTALHHVPQTYLNALRGLLLAAGTA